MPVSITNLKIRGCQRWCTEFRRMPGTRGTRANSSPAASKKNSNVFYGRPLSMNIAKKKKSRFEKDLNLQIHLLKLDIFLFPPVFRFVKVHVLKEGYKILKKSPSFPMMNNIPSKKNWDILSNYFGFFRKKKSLN